MRERATVQHATALALGCLFGWLGCGQDGPRSDDSAATDANTAGRESAAGAHCDAGRLRTYYRDDDRDGFGVPGPGAAPGCEADPPAGLADNARDCDDSDPGKGRAVLVDADGDGFGTGDPVCAPADAGGFSWRAGDCDDDDPERSPAAVEGWFDAYDADCDGEDNPAGCIAAPGVPRERYATGEIIELPPRGSIPVDSAPDCAGAADLYLAILGACPVCGGALATVVVANAGSVPAAFRVMTNDADAEVALELLPGQVAEPLSLRMSSPESAVTVSPLAGVRDCRPENDAKTVVFGFTDCAAP